MKINFLLLIILIIKIVGAQESKQCWTGCQNCTSTNPFSCTSCYPNTYIYITSCQMISYATDQFLKGISITFETFSIICCVLMLFLTFIGVCVVHEAFENLQLIALITWGYNLQYGGQSMTLLNWCKIIDGLQGTPTILLFIVLVSFVIFASICWVSDLAKRSVKTRVLLFFQRKRFVILYRIYHLTVTPLLFASILDLNNSLKGRPWWTSIPGVIYQVIAAFVFVFNNVIIFNMKTLEQPAKYCFVQGLSKLNTQSKYRYLFDTVLRFSLIITYTNVFSQNQLLLLIICFFYSLYFIYYLVFVHFINFRYKIINLSSILILITQVIISTIASIKIQNPILYSQFQISWVTISFISLISMCVILFIQTWVNRYKIKKVIRQLYIRFIKCQDKQVVLKQGDIAFKKQRVQAFTPNPLFNKQIELFIRDSI